MWGEKADEKSDLPHIGSTQKEGGMKEYKIKTQYVVEGGILDGTILEPIMAFLAVKYPHRKSKDLYVPPMKSGDKEFKIWHCCQDNCSTPDFSGGVDALIEHLMLHKGRLLKPWNKRQQLKSPIPAIRIPPNPWDGKPKMGANEDRQFCEFLTAYIQF